jgi:hypothetical protein
MTIHDENSCPCVYCQRIRRGNEDAITFTGAMFLVAIIMAVATIAAEVFGR